MPAKRMLGFGLALAFLFAPGVLAQEQPAAKVMPKRKLGSSVPFARLTKDGRLHIAYVETAETATTVRYRQMFGDAPVESTISAEGEKPSHFGESPPVLEVMGDGTIYVLYTVRVPPVPGADYPIELRLTTSKDGGRSWAPYRVMGDPEARVFHGCAALHEDAKGRLIMSWLEGHPGKSAIGVKTAIMSGDKIDYTFVDDVSCECCATELALAADGSMWLAYRDKDEFNVRDMYLTRMTKADSRFGPPARVSEDKWFVKGCPETGPRLAFEGSETAWITWFNGNPRGIYVSHATIASPQFAPRELVQPMNEHYTGLAHPDLKQLPDGRWLLAYQCTKDGYQHVEGRLRAGEKWSEAIALGGSGEYPRIVSNGTKAYFMYTMIGENDKSISVRDVADALAGK